MTMPSERTTKTPLVSDRVFKFLRRLVEFVLPALGTLYFTLNQIWGENLFPNAEQVVGTIVAFTVFLSAGVLISRKAYLDSDERFDGMIGLENVNEEEGTASVHVGMNAAVLQDKDEVTLKVGRHRAEP